MPRRWAPAPSHSPCAPASMRDSTSSGPTRCAPLAAATSRRPCPRRISPTAPATSTKFVIGASREAHSPRARRRSSARQPVSAEGDASVRSRTPVPDSGAPEPSLGSRRAPPDSAQAPIIDERSGRWVVEPLAEPGGSPGPSDDASSRTTDVSWESGLQVSDDSEFDAGDAYDCGRLGFLQCGVRARGRGPGGRRRRAARPGRERRRPLRLDDRPRRRHGGRRCEPDRHRLRTGRFHH